MNYAAFKQSVSDLKTVINGKKNFAGQFAATRVSLNNKQYRVIWNGFTHNVVAFHRIDADVIHVRASSRYLDSLSRGKRIIVASKNLARLRRHAQTLDNQAFANYYIDKAVRDVCQAKVGTEVTINLGPKAEFRSYIGENISSHLYDKGLRGREYHIIKDAGHNHEPAVTIKVPHKLRK